MNDFDALAERYLDSWNETDQQARLSIVEELYAPDARYVDPMVAAEGTQAIAEAIGAVQTQLPGFRFRRVGAVDGHHDQARFSWECGPDGADAPIAGFDVITLDGSGRVQAVLGFLDRVPG